MVKSDPKIIIDELLPKVPLMELLEIYYAVRWHVEEVAIHLQNKKYADYLKRLTAEFKRRESVLNNM